MTRASGKSRTVTRRRTKNNRLAGISYCWAFTASSRPSPQREHYLLRRERGDGHPAALRHLFNRKASASCTTAWQPGRPRPGQSLPAPTTKPGKIAATTPT